MAGLKVKTDGFDMFAETQAVGAEIHAITSRLVRVQIPNLDRIGQAAGGFDAEVGKDGMRGRQVGDDERFLAGALAALVDFVRVGGAPVVRRRQFDLQIRFGSRCHEDKE